MEISEMKRRIMDKIKEKNQDASGKEKKINLYTLSAKMGISEDDISKVFKTQAAERDMANVTLDAPEDVKTEKPVTDSNIEEPIEEYLKKLSNADSEIRALKQLCEQAIKGRHSLLAQVKEKDKTIIELEKKVKDEFSESEREKEAVLANMEMLRSKINSLTKESKEQISRIVQLEEMLKTRDSKLAEFDKLYEDIEERKAEAAKTLEYREKENERLREGMLNLRLELDAITKKLEESNRRYKDTELEKANMALKVTISEKERRDFEDALLKLRIKVEAAEKQREDDRITMEGRFKDLKAETDRLRETVKEKERRELDFNKAIDRLTSEIEIRDKKIEADTVYQENIVREINELRKRVKNS